MKSVLVLLIFLQLNDPESIVREFYDWYLAEGKDDLKPRFTELSNGMTGLDFSQADSLMTNFHFSEAFIQNSKSSYKDCMENLSTVSYTEFSEFDDIDDIENLGCSLQAYQWMNNTFEPYDYYKIINSDNISEDEIKYSIKFGYEGTKKYQSTTEVTVRLIDENWYIERIE